MPKEEYSKNGNIHANQYKYKNIRILQMFTKFAKHTNPLTPSTLLKFYDDNKNSILSRFK